MPNIPHTSPNNFRKDAVSVDIPIHLDSRLAIDYHVTLAVFATSLDNCDHLWSSDSPSLIAAVFQSVS